ncbi:MAG TPA: helix-hairpin-helix domain-containing protein, partial [Puia sp.]|nr:helix-hairpin-helix domain-containing protein [Puia sp.]
MAKSRAQTDHNQALAAIFHQMAACYRYLGSREKFRALAYDNASRTIAGLEEDVSVYAGSILQLEELKGVGESIAEKIEEYLETGRISTFEQLKKKVPVGLLELMDVNGFGPATVKILHEKLGIGNRAELLAALEGKKMEKLKGFGEKKIENMRRGLTLFAASQGRMLLWDAMHLGGEMLDDLKNISGVREAIIAGSLRRKKETIGDIDLVATADKKDWKKIIDKFTSLPAVRTVLAGGETKASILVENTNTQVDLRLVHPEEYGAALLYFTGSREHTVYLRTWAKSRGWKVNEYGVFEAKNNKKLAGASEAEIYKLFGLDYIPPELREQRGEIDAAAKKSLPLLVEEKDIRGDMHMHSTWSDGAEKIESIAGYLLKKFPAYEYMVITDHSPSERVAHGLPPRD